ncbi:hypothetical protein BDV27DRAFT_136332 [Aspergillus caelatus]|uniref:Uncharacterized protein n=1 Tax=Aspergillus caelatus TaxID=61420 RepID=A0A5N6ZPQ2_9EURO|nr:uncharacterized protein BDV27DRAFT_136332 [Aspergillus caelatus]KAE8359348.1 hypothetical protein BDV27DRAFT_136332 [Aspergillus caelatus]
MLVLGQQLQQLYADQLKLLPVVLNNPRTMRFRLSPFSESFRILAAYCFGDVPSWYPFGFFWSACYRHGISRE